VEICQKCGKPKKFLVNHHPDRKNKPNLTVRWCVECHRKYHENLPRRGELTDLMRRYKKIQSLRVSLGNWQNQFERITDKKYGKVSKLESELKLEEEKLVEEAIPLVKEELEILGKIKGLGPKSVVKVIAFGDPRWFDTMSAFLAFWGCTKEKSFKCNHWLKGISYDMVTHLFMSKNENYVKGYYFFKEKGLKSQQARNRVRTFLLKEIYCKLNKPRGPYTLLVNGEPRWFQKEVEE